MAQMMKGVCLTRHGGPDALEWREDIPVPVPGPGQVLVKVLAAGVNNTDINTRIGWYSSEVTGATDAVGDDAEVEAGGWGGALSFPRIQGGDLCGLVVQTGPDTGAIRVGQRVTSQINIPRPQPDNPVAFVALGSELDGAFAQYCLMEAAELFDVSASPLSDTEIAAMPCAYGTAWNLLHRAGVSGGQRVFVTGASGGVGLAAVQLAARLGAQVTGQTSPAKAEAVTAMGAGSIIGREDSPEPGGFDAVIDVVGGPAWPALIQALRPGGHYAVSGAIAGPIVTADLREIYLRDITIHGCTFSPRTVFAELVELINSGAIRPLVSATYPLQDIARAQADFMSKAFPGKLVLIPPQEAT
ncbi:alcohol dehydrogenase family protein [Leisingera sp. S132]|uniref:alcohol dehydrogenase family protein n=1 Tax=Leisingera sp. S132 TaxID=2867016 RepID=UPI0021A2F704|nr:alcohol dehydrogenase family protein [Leisingera sp. S132]UWQ79098.1 alcohol dehydrogenase family protein [Leisingera sp. S132]